jgi:hypothetical protein
LTINDSHVLIANLSPPLPRQEPKSILQLDSMDLLERISIAQLRILARIVSEALASPWDFTHMICWL